jgi:hypothetical protein
MVLPSREESREPDHQSASPQRSRHRRRVRQARADGGGGPHRRDPVRER